jgi:hypothetical protein
LHELRNAGCNKIFQEEVSSTVKARPQLEIALDYVRQGDIFLVTRLDRLARSVADLVNITERLKAKDVGLRILSMNLDTETPTGKLMMNLLGSIAEFERELMLERQKDGIARAKVEGKYKGRKPTAKGNHSAKANWDEGCRDCSNRWCQSCQRLSSIEQLEQTPVLGLRLQVAFPTWLKCEFRPFGDLGCPHKRSSHCVPNSTI